MTSLLQGVVVVGIVLLPGACAAWGYRRHTLSYGNRLRDWLLRLGGLSAAIWAAGSWPVYWIYANYWKSFAAGDPIPRALALLPVAYLLVPLVVGWTIGRAVSHNKRWVMLLLGSRRAPRAWDHLFERQRSGLVRCRMKSGAWIGGLFDDTGLPPSYAAGEAEALDLYVGQALHLDQRSGAIRYREHQRQDGNASHGSAAPDFTGGGLLIKWDEVEYLEFVNLDRASKPSSETRPAAESPDDDR